MGISNDTVQNTYTTTDNETASVVSYSMPSNSYGKLLVTIIGKDEASNNVVVVEKLVGIKRASGAVTEVGLESTTLENKDLSLATTSYSISHSGSTISVNVTGVLGLDIDWFVKMEFLLVGNF